MPTETPPQTTTEQFTLTGERVLEELKRLLGEGNIRRVIVKQGDRVVAEFPLTAGVVGALVAPSLAAVGAVIALATDCTIIVEKDVPAAEGSATELTTTT